MERSKVVSCKVLTAEAGQCPSLVSFPVGVPPNAGEMELQLVYRTHGNKKKRVVSTAIDGLLFRGCDDGDFSSANSAVQFAVGRIDESTGVMRVIPAGHAFIMRPTLEKVDKTLAPPRLSSMSTMERREMRTEAFGSRKKKRAQQVAASNSISAQNISGASVVEESMTNAVNMDDESENLNATERAISNNRSLYLPTFNLDATAPADIFPILGLVPEQVDAALEELSDKIYKSIEDEWGQGEVGGNGDESQQRKKLKSGQLCEYFLSHMQTKESASECVLRSILRLKDGLGSKKGEEEDRGKDKDKDKYQRKHLKRVSRRVIMLHFMVRFHQAMTTAVGNFKSDVVREEIERAIKAPRVISKRLFDAFTSASTYKGKVAFTKLDHDKLKIHIIAVALHVNNFSCSLSSIAKDLKLVDKGMTDLARQMGCKVVKEKDSLGGREIFASLSAPLIFPQERRPLKKK